MLRHAPASPAPGLQGEKHTGCSRLDEAKIHASASSALGLQGELETQGRELSRQLQTPFASRPIATAGYP